MDWKRVIEDETRRREAGIARDAVKEALCTGTPADVRMRDMLAELQGDARLLQAFEALTVDELRDLFGRGAAGRYGKPGPDRRHGVTAKRIHAYVGDHPGCSLGDVRKALGLKLGTIASQMKRLHVEGKLRAEGRERQYRYFAA